MLYGLILSYSLFLQTKFVPFKDIKKRYKRSTKEKKKGEKLRIFAKTLTHIESQKNKLSKIRLNGVGGSLSDTELTKYIIQLFFICNVPSNFS